MLLAGCGAASKVDLPDPGDPDSEVVLESPRGGEEAGSTYVDGEPAPENPDGWGSVDHPYPPNPDGTGWGQPIGCSRQPCPGPAAR